MKAGEVPLSYDTIKGIMEFMKTAPETELDPTIVVKITKLIEEEKPKAIDLKKILDECAYASLASDFVMYILHLCWNGLKHIERVENNA